MNLDGKEMEEEDPFEKVRNFLEKQDLQAIDEGNEQKKKRKKNNKKK